MSRPLPYKCNKDHVAVLGSNGYSCDGCRKGGNSGEHFKCPPCNYDLCLTCAPVTPEAIAASKPAPAPAKPARPVPYKCDKGHLAKLGSGGFSCDGCKKGGNSGEHFKCAPCNYDLCLTCAPMSMEAISASNGTPIPTPAPTAAPVVAAATLVPAIASSALAPAPAIATSAPTATRAATAPAPASAPAGPLVSPLLSFPYGTAAGRHGPAVCVLSVLSPPDGGQRLVHSSNVSESQRDFPTVAPEAVSVTAGKWYYEVVLRGKGFVQVGAVLANKFTCVSGRQTGVGNDARSWAVDLSGPKLFNAGKSTALSGTNKWNSGDVVGVAIELEEHAHCIAWTLNGTEVARVDLCATGSDYKHGDALVPAASVDVREGLVWRFVASELKNLPTAFSALQAVATPTVLTAPIKQEEVDAEATKAKQQNVAAPSDVLGDAALLAAIISGYTANKAGANAVFVATEKAAKTFASVRGGACEYGLDNELSRLASDMKTLSSGGAFEGTAPKVEIKRSFANDAEAAEKKLSDMRTMMRRVNWTLLAVLYVYGHEDAAVRTILTSAMPVAVAVSTTLAEAVQKLRYVAAIQDRKANGVLQYGLFWELERFNGAVDKDRSKMSERDTEAHIKALDEQAGRLRKWRDWFIAQAGGEAAVASSAAHTSALAVLDEALSKYTKLTTGAAGELNAKAVAKAEKDLSEKIESGRRRIKEALGEFERFPERAEAKYKDLNTEIDTWRAAADKAAKENTAAQGIALVVSSAALGAWATEVREATNKWRVAEDLRLLTRQAEEAIREVNSKVNSGLQMIDHHRKDEAIKCLHEAKELVEKLKQRPGFFSLPLVTAFFDKYEGERDKLEKLIAKWILNRETSDAARELNSTVNSVDDLFSHYRNEEALKVHHKAEELRKALAERARGEWAGIDVVLKALAAAASKGEAFTRAYKERVLTKEADERTRECRSALGTAKDMLFHSRHEEALAALSKCKELTVALRDNTALAGLASVDEWLITYARDAPELEAKVNKTILDREVSDAVRNVTSLYGQCEDHFGHYRFEAALTALSAYREAGAALERNTRFAGHPDAEAALCVFDTNVPAFESKYRDTMLKREYDEAVREANSKLGKANDMFEHHRMDEALSALHEYREAIEAMSKREDFSSLGGNEVVKRARDEQIPAWEAKYVEKVLGARCSEAVRGINSALGSARDYLDHYNEEAFLKALRDAETRMSAVVPADDSAKGSDVMLIYAMSEMQDALKNAAQSVWQLKQAFDVRNRERLIDEAMRAVSSAKERSADMLFHSRFEEALTELVRARQALDELTSAPFAIGAERVTGFVVKLRGELSELDGKISTTLRTRQLDDAKRTLASARSSYEQLFDHYRNDEALGALAKAKDAADLLERDFSAAEAGADLSAARAAFTAFEAAYSERVLTKEAGEAVSRAKGELSLAESHLSHSRFERALESLSSARAAYASVLLNTRLANVPVVKELSKEFDGRLSEVAQRIDTVLNERQVDDAIRTLSSSIGEMEQHFEHHRSEAALTSFANSKALLEALQSTHGGANALATRKNEINNSISQATQQLATFQTKYRDREMSSKIREMTGAALSRLSEAESALEHSRFEEALEKSQAASAAAAAVGGDAMLMGATEVEAFVTAFTARHAALTQKWRSTVRARAESDARRRASSAMSEAKELFDHHRNEESLTKLQAAREAVEAFAAEFGADASAGAFITEQRKAQGEFEAAYSERVFKAELDRKMAKARSRLSAATDALEHHRHEEALRTVAEADEACGVLAGDERFVSHSGVSTFVAQYNTDAASLKARIKATLTERASADVKRRLGSAMSDAESLYGHCRFEEALRAVATVKSIMEDEEEGSAEKNGEIATRLAAFKECYAREHLSREADAQVKRAESALGQAEFLLDHHRHEEALTALQGAREQAVALNDTKFDGVVVVKGFFDAWPNKLRTVQTAISTRLLAKRARDAADEVRTPLNEARTALDKHMHEAALERLQIARDRVASLRQAGGADAELCMVEPLKATLGEFDAQSSEIGARLNKEVYGKEVTEALRVIRSHMSSAEQLFSRCAHEAALTAFQEARDAVSAASVDARLSGSDEVGSFIKGEWADRNKAFSGKYAEAVLTDEARRVVAESRASLSRAVLFTERNVRDKAEEALKATIASAAAVLAEDGLMSSLSGIVKPFMTEVRAAEAAFAEKFLREEASAAIKEAKSHLEGAARARSRALDESAASELTAARTAVASLLGTSLKAPVSSSYASLALVTDFITKQLVPAYGPNAATDLFEVARGGGATGGKSTTKGGKKDTIDGILGPRFPQLVILRKGLPFIAISTDVHPKFFSSLKITNQAAKAVEKEVKELIEGVKAVNFEAKSSHASPIAASLFSRGAPAGYPVEGVERGLVDFAKGMTSMQADAKDEELTKKVAGQYEAFSVAWRETLAVLKRFDALQKNAQGMEWVVQFVSGFVTDFDGYQCSTCPRRVDVSFMDDYNPIGLQYSEAKQGDYSIFMFVVSVCKRALERIDGWVKEFGGFPAEEQLRKYLNDTILHAKRTHVQHCIRQCTRAGDDNRKLYVEALRRFPLAMAQAKAAVEYHYKKVNEREAKEDEKAVQWPENISAATGSDVDPDEKPDWYLHEFIPIQPGSATQFDKKADMSSAGAAMWTDARRALAGKIVFSATPIDDSGEFKNDTEARFNLAEAVAGDGIFARAYWAHAVRNYAIAKRRDNGSLVYAPVVMNGSRHRLEVMTVVRVDGKPLVRPLQPHGSWSWFTWTSPEGAEKRKAQETTVDFYGWSQTCKFSVLSATVHESLNDEWVRQAARFAYEFTRLSAGEHRVEIDLCFRITSLLENFDSHPAQGRAYPEMDTEMSTPLASGAFTLVVPSTPVERRSILPVRPSKGLSLQVVELARLESVVIDTMKKMPDWGGRARQTELPMHAIVTSDWYESEFEKEVVGQDRHTGRILVTKYCVRCAFEFTVVLKRLAKHGWSTDQVAVFHLAAYGPHQRNPPKSIPPMTGVGVASSFTFEPELLKDFSKRKTNQ